VRRRLVLGLGELLPLLLAVHGQWHDLFLEELQAGPVGSLAEKGQQPGTLQLHAAFAIGQGYRCQDQFGSQSLDGTDQRVLDLKTMSTLGVVPLGDRQQGGSEFRTERQIS